MNSKLILSGALIILASVGTTACSDDPVIRIAKDPAQAEAEFASPTGTIDNSNATSAVNSLLAGYIPLTLFYELSLNTTVLDDPDAETYASCFSDRTDRSHTEMNVKCLSDLGGFGARDDDDGSLIETCSGSGSVAFSTTKTESTSTMTDVTMDCDETFTVKNTFGNYRALPLLLGQEDPSISCMDVGYEFKGAGNEFNGCWISFNPTYAVIEIGGGTANVHVISMTSDTSICAEIVDSQGTLKADCAVVSTLGFDEASSINNIKEVENCAISRGESC